jgi:hypothetical protein
MVVPLLSKVEPKTGSSMSGCTSQSSGTMSTP